MSPPPDVTCPGRHGAQVSRDSRAGNPARRDAPGRSFSAYSPWRRHLASGTPQSGPLNCRNCARRQTLAISRIAPSLVRETKQTPALTCGYVVAGVDCGIAGAQEAPDSPAAVRHGDGDVHGARLRRRPVSEVAAACGVSEKTVFNYFPTKESLLLDR